MGFTRRLTRIVLPTLLVAGILVSLDTPAQALFHLTNVREVFSGTAAQPTAQFIELQMYAGNQNFVLGEQVSITDPSGTEVGSFIFTSNLANGADQSSILIATPDAQILFGVTADLEMTPVIQGVGGSVCFGSAEPPVDCASWGTYSGDTSQTGTPFNAPIGFVPGQAMERKISGGTDADRLDAEDDTNDSAADFQFAPPTPTNNAGEGSAEITEHARTVSLTLKGNVNAKGRVEVEDGFEGCFQKVPVKIQRRSAGRWRAVKTATTDAEGGYRVRLKDRPGRYRAVAPVLMPTSEDECLVARSRTRKNS